MEIKRNSNERKYSISGSVDFEGQRNWKKDALRNFAFLQNQ